MNSGPAYTKIAKSAKASVALLPLLPSCKRNPGSVRGTVILVTLCFVAVLGIALASYLAVCSRAMQLSNRAFQNELSKQLAEAAVEEGLRAFNKNNWADWTSGTTSVDWTLDTSNRRATATMTLPSSKFGQGATATVKVRVDNYDAPWLGSTYSSSTTYRMNDVVSNGSGVWYRSMRNSNTGNTPSATMPIWWAPIPMPWAWGSDVPYIQYNTVNYDGIWYRAITAPTTTNPTAGTTTYMPQIPLPATTYWTPIPTVRAVWSSGVSYAVYDVVSYNGGIYRCTSAHTSSAAFATDSAKWSSDVRGITLNWASGVYTRGAICYYVGASIYRWYYCIQSGNSATAPNVDTTMWAPIWYDAGGSAANPASDTVSAVAYYPGDYAYIGGTWYRCTTAHTYVNWATSSGNWTSTNALPYLTLMYRGVTSPDLTIYYMGATWYRFIGSSWVVATTGTMHAWASGIKYNLGDTVYYTSNGRWYRCTLAHTSSATVIPTSTTYWATTPSLPLTWEVNRQYSQYDTAYYNGIWYLSLQSSNYGNVPNAASSTYWAAAPRSVSPWNSTKTYNLDDLVSLSGTWYRCIRSHSAQSPPNGTYWTVLTGAAYVWSSTTAYTAATSYASYDGVWYNCATANTGSSPNSYTHWTPKGAPVVYGEATVTIANSPSTKTQIRAPIAPAPLFPNAVGGSDSVSISGGAGTVESYDGSVYSMNTGGTYNTYTYGQTSGVFSGSPGWNKGYAAVLAAGGTASASLSIGNSTDVKGYAAALSASTSPFAPLASFGSSATVKSYSSPGSPNVDTSRVSRSPYVPQFDIQPAVLSTAFTAATLNKGTLLTLATPTYIGTPGAVVPSRYYINANVSLAAGQVLYINGPVILYINGYLRTNTGSVVVTTTGSAEIHFSSYLRNYSGGGGFINRTKDPRKLVLIGDVSTSTLNCYFYSFTDPQGWDSTFYGTVYLPNTTSTGGFTVYTGTVINGALSAKAVTFNSEANVRYDTSLRYATFGGVDQPYTVTNWTELSTTEAATMP